MPAEPFEITLVGVGEGEDGKAPAARTWPWEEAGYALPTDRELRTDRQPAAGGAGVDRTNLRKRYPREVDIIIGLMPPDRRPKRGYRDRRTGGMQAVDEKDD